MGCDSNSFFKRGIKYFRGVQKFQAKVVRGVHFLGGSKYIATALGRPAYFDLSVRYTTKPSFISSATCQAGITAAASEEAKDDRY